MENIKNVLIQMHENSIEQSKRHIKNLRQFSKDMDDWNIYVVEQWRSIRFCKKMIAQLKNGG
jgi:intracellular sulfur oxidation DsrE/DsrF family protein